MMTFTVKFPVSKATAEALLHFDGKMKEAGLDFFLLGASARDLMMNNVWGLPSGTATRDIDFAFALSSWSDYSHIREAFQKSKSFHLDTKVFHRIHFLSSDNTSIPIDLIPFGNLESPPGKIQWPNQQEIVMDVTGFREALNSAIEVEFSPNSKIKVASPLSMVFLKFLAWQDRRFQINHDAFDIYLFLRNYSEMGNEDRLYSDEFQILKDSAYDPVIAGARLLGVDLSKCHLASQVFLKEFANNTTNRNELHRQIFLSLPNFEDQQKLATAILNAFFAAFI